MRILFIQKHADGGGAVSSLAEALAACAGTGLVTPAVLSAGDGRLTTACRKLDVEVFQTMLPEWRKLRDCWVRKRRLSKAADLARSFAPDVVIANEMWMAPQARVIAAHLGARSACIVRDFIAAGRRARQYHLHQLDRVLCVSAAMGDALSANGVPRNRLRTLYNPIAAPVPAPAMQPQTPADFPEVRRWLVVVGSVCGRKDQADAVRVLAALHQQGGRDWGLLLAGALDPSYKETLNATIRSAGLQQSVWVAGHVEPVGAAFAAASAVLSTSEREGLPRSLIESFLCGKPAFACDLPGLDEIYGAGHSDWTVDGADADAPEKMARCILRAFQHPDELAAETSRLRARLETGFHSETYPNRLMAALND
jgi:glycosyltransferase involved in cell wall biosynthesis